MPDVRKRMPTGRGGVTMVEVLVVIGILGLLTALLLPAVQQARETSRRVTCRNNLRQVGVAIANFAQSHGAFPTADKPESAYRRLLPYLEARALHDVLAAHEVPEPGLWSVPVLLCPDDPVARANMIVGESNYFYNVGTQFRLYDPTNGFRKGGKGDTKASEVSDGLSNTVAMAERLVRSNTERPPSSAAVAEKEPRRYFWWTETRFGGRGQEALAIEECRDHRTTPFPQFFGLSAMNYHSSYGYDHMLPPNHPGCYNGPEDFGVESELFLIPASSLHPGGVNALLGDGGVHFVSETIDAAVWLALGTRSGRESAANPFGT